MLRRSGLLPLLRQWFHLFRFGSCRFRRTPFGQCENAIDNSIDINCRQHRAFLTIDEFRHDILHGIEQIENLGGDLNGLVNHPVDHILYRPGQFTDDLCTHQPPTTLQGMERATKSDEGVLVIIILLPARQVFLNNLQLFPCLFDENFQDFRVDILKRRFVCRRDRDLLRRRLNISLFHLPGANINGGWGLQGFTRNGFFSL